MRNWSLKTQIAQCHKKLNLLWPEWGRPPGTNRDHLQDMGKTQKKTWGFCMALQNKIYRKRIDELMVMNLTIGPTGWESVSVQMIFHHGLLNKTHVCSENVSWEKPFSCCNLWVKSGRRPEIGLWLKISTATGISAAFVNARWKMEGVFYVEKAVVSDYTQILV